MLSVFLRPDAVQPAAPNPHYRVVHFDVRGVDLTNSTLVKAEFRIFRAPNPQARASEQRVEIYQVNSSTSPVHQQPNKLNFLSIIMSLKSLQAPFVPLIINEADPGVSYSLVSPLWKIPFKKKMCVWICPFMVLASGQHNYYDTKSSPIKLYLYFGLRGDILHLLTEKC